MRKVNFKRHAPRPLCSLIRRQYGVVVCLTDLEPLLGRWPVPLQAIRKLEAAKLAVLIPGNGLNYRLAEPIKKPTRRPKDYRYKTAVAFLPGQIPKPCGATSTPGVGRETWVKLGPLGERVRFRGKIPGGWLVEPCGEWNETD